MRSAIALILSFLLLSFAFVTGFFLFLWLAILFAGILFYLVIRQKLAGHKRKPPYIIEAEYYEVKDK
jgi:hypothetical protein